MTMPKGWIPHSATEKSKGDKDELVFDLIKRRYDTEMQKTNALDTKAASLIGFVSVVVGLIAGGSTFQLSVIARYWYLSIPYFVSVALLLACIFFGLKAFRERRWRVVPNVEVLRDKYARPETSYSYVLETTGAAMVEAIDSSEKTNKKKSDDLNCSWLLLIFGLSLVFAFLILFAYTVTYTQNTAIDNGSSKNVTSKQSARMIG